MAHLGHCLNHRAKVVLQWRKRDKFVAELMEKLGPLNLDASLVEALQAAMGLRKEQRGGFALKVGARPPQSIN